MYSLPLSANRRHGGAGTIDRKKRKRTAQNLSKSHDPVKENAETSMDEYTAVLSPLARSQRRLAGQSLGRDLPAPPFPHADTSKARQNVEGIGRHLETGLQPPQHPKTPRSLHLQHLSCLTAILHRSILDEDFTRASRAFGLILRDDIHGLPTDIRAAGNWAIGAEILLNAKQAPISESELDGRGVEGPRAPNNAFQMAKNYYEVLIVQHPYHTAWPASTNGIDFYLSLFNLWIYVAHEKGKGLVEDNRSTSPSSPQASSPRPPSAIERELEEANEIAARMDQCMTSVPYMDNSELIRLRAMVALWQADLNIGCAQYLARDEVAMQHESSTDDTPIAAAAVTATDTQRHIEYSQNSQAARDTAGRLFAKLGAGRGTEHTSDTDE